MYIVLASDILLVVLEIPSLHLNCGVVDLVLPADIGEFLQHIDLLETVREYVRCEEDLAWSQLPHVEVVDLLDLGVAHHLLLEVVGVDLGGSGFEDDVVALLGDGVGGAEHEDGEDVGGDGVQVVPLVELGDFFAVVGAVEVDEDGRDHEAH